MNTNDFTPKKHTVDVSKIYNGEKSEIEFDFDFQPENEADNDLVFPESVKVKGKAYEKARGRNDNEGYVGLEICLTGKYITHCARCAKELTKTFDIKADYGVTRDTADDCEAYVEAPKGILDIDENARTLFYLNLPNRVLCREDCLGLCPVCGKDLNSGTCSCKPEDNANRLSGLKKLLDNKEEK